MNNEWNCVARPVHPPCTANQHHWYGSLNAYISVLFYSFQCASLFSATSIVFDGDIRYRAMPSRNIEFKIAHCICSAASGSTEWCVQNSNGIFFFSTRALIRIHNDVGRLCAYMFLYKSKRNEADRLTLANLDIAHLLWIRLLFFLPRFQRRRLVHQLFDGYISSTSDNQHQR